jgi:hypothetical protein
MDQQLLQHWQRLEVNFAEEECCLRQLYAEANQLFEFIEVQQAAAQLTAFQHGVRFKKEDEFISPPSPPYNPDTPPLEPRPVATPPLGRTPEETTPPPPAPRPKGQTPRPLPNGPPLQHPQPRKAERLPVNFPPAQTLSAIAQPSYSPPPLHYQDGPVHGKVYSYVRNFPPEQLLTATARPTISPIPLERRQPTYVRTPAGNPCLYPHQQPPVATYPLRNNGYVTYQTPVITYHGHYWNQEQLRWIPYF